MSTRRDHSGSSGKGRRQSIRELRSAIQCPRINAINAKIPVVYSWRNRELPAVNYHMTKKGFRAEVMIPADTWPEKGVSSEVIIRAGTEFEDKLRLLAETDMSIVEASFALFIITSPKSSITNPPIVARYKIIAFP